MKKVLWFLLLMGLCGTAKAWQAPDFAVTFTTDTRTVTVTTITASPTLLFNYNASAQRTFIVNASTFTIFISTANSGFSTTSTFGIPGITAGNTPITFSPDGVNSPYVGQIYAISNGNGGASISVFRSK